MWFLPLHLIAHFCCAYHTCTLILSHIVIYSLPPRRMKKPCVTYKVWQEKGGRAVGQAVVVKFSPWEGQEKGDSWSDVSDVIACMHTCTDTQNIISNVDFSR